MGWVWEIGLLGVGSERGEEWEWNDWFFDIVCDLVWISCLDGGGNGCGM